MSRYTPPQLDGHKVAFKGKRFWIIEVEEGRDFEHISKDYADLAIYDTAEQMLIGWALREEDGGFRCGTWAGQIEVHYYVEKLEDLGKVTHAESWKLFRACS